MNTQIYVGSNEGSLLETTRKFTNKMILEPQTSTPLKIPSNFLVNSTQQMVQQESNDNQKSTRFLSNRAVALLNKWFIENRDYPYPDEQTTDFLAREAEISTKQVKKWFANKRVRSQLCCKPIHRNRKSRSSIGSNNQSNENVKYMTQSEPKSFPNEQHNYPSLRLSIQNQHQQHQNSPFQPSSLLQPALGYQSKFPSVQPQPNIVNNLMRPFGASIQNPLQSTPATSQFYNHFMLMNLLASQRQAQIQNLNLISKLSNQSSSTTSASISSAVSNSSSNSNEDDLQEEEEDEEQHEEQIDDNDQMVDIDQESNSGEDEPNSNQHLINNGHQFNKQNERFISMLMMMNSNFNKNQHFRPNETANVIDDHISSISPPPSGSSICTTSSNSVSALPCISSSSSSSSCSSSSNNSKNTTPNTDSNKYLLPGLYMEKDQQDEEESESVETRLNVTSDDDQKSKKPIEKKINFAIISTLVD